MIQELIFTSAREGLKPGSNGFCTVARSRDMAAADVAMLERLSSYPYFESPAPRPTVLRHVCLATESGPRHLLSRIVDAGTDHSGRSNALAHHLLLSPSDLPDLASPADLLLRYPWRSAWPDPPNYLREISRDTLATYAAPAPPDGSAWRAAFGDAKWRRILAARWLGDANETQWLVFPPERLADALPLFAESLAVLPDTDRWAVTFAIGDGSTAGDGPLSWHAVQPDHKGLAAARRVTPAAVLALPAPGTTLPVPSLCREPLPDPAATHFLAAAAAAADAQYAADAGDGAAATPADASGKAPTTVPAESLAKTTRPWLLLWLALLLITLIVGLTWDAKRRAAAAPPTPPTTRKAITPAELKMEAEEAAAEAAAADAEAEAGATQSEAIIPPPTPSDPPPVEPDGETPPTPTPPPLTPPVGDAADAADSTDAKAAPEALEEAAKAPAPAQHGLPPNGPRGPERPMFRPGGLATPGPAALPTTDSTEPPLPPTTTTTPPTQDAPAP